MNRGKGYAYAGKRELGEDCCGSSLAAGKWAAACFFSDGRCCSVMCWRVLPLEHRMVPFYFFKLKYDCFMMLC